MFFISEARQAFTELRQAFVKAPILNHFDLERHIQIKIDTSGYTISRILRQMTLDNLGQWDPVVFFSKKMIPTETRCEIYDSELLSIIEVFKT